MRVNRNYLSNELGFTLIELLFTIAIISILSGLSWGAFYVYREDAEYSKAEHLVKSAQTAIVLGEMEAADGTNFGFDVSGTDGGPVDATMATYLPGAVTPKDVKLGAMITACNGSKSAALVNLMLVAQPCKAERQVQWFQFCSGDNLLLGDVAFGGGC
jgi:prepilin-type N-terminal cleavage/methylation domain-containing protein